jgi:enamine deaminase RidA (YjgF/YER057c/UK114 family)
MHVRAGSFPFSNHLSYAAHLRVLRKVRQIDPRNVRGTFAEQTDAVMRNLETMLKAAGSDWSRVLHVEHLFAAGAPKPIAPFSHRNGVGAAAFRDGADADHRRDRRVRG